MNIILLFAVLTIVNVIIQTVRSIATIKCGKGVASLVNAVAYGLYTIIVIYTTMDTYKADGSVNWELVGLKALITAVANLIGVYVVKLIEEKSHKDKLWKIELAVPFEQANSVKKMIGENIPCNYQYLGKWCIFNCYCATHKQTARLVAIAKGCNGKISAYESQNLI